MWQGKAPFSRSSQYHGGLRCTVPRQSQTHCKSFRCPQNACSPSHVPEIAWWVVVRRQRYTHQGWHLPQIGRHKGAKEEPEKKEIEMRTLPTPIFGVKWVHSRQGPRGGAGGMGTIHPPSPVSPSARGIFLGGSEAAQEILGLFFVIFFVTPLTGGGAWLSGPGGCPNPPSHLTS